ncbi:MAG: hypothetical protein Q8Q28_12965 [Pseudomonadota bacterium]|nr:hypothetical protein [Pseudomonadota bacterium]
MAKAPTPIIIPESPETAPAPRKSRKRAAQVAPKVEAAVEVVVVETAAAEPAAVEAPPEAKPGKQKKARLVRDSFTMPETEYQLIAAIKKRCLDAGVAARKSEILRAAITGLAKLGDAELITAIQSLATIKTGRPAKDAK